MEREELLGVLVVCRISALCLEGPSICLDAPAGLPLHLTGGWGGGQSPPIENPSLHSHGKRGAF